MKGPRPSTLSAMLALVACGTAAAQEPQDVRPEPYRDRIIAPDRLEPLPEDEDDEGEGGPGAGLPRSWRIELGVGRNERDDRAFHEQGLTASGFWETEGSGAFSLDAGVFHSDRESERAFGGPRWGGTATLWQRDLPMSGGWRIDSGIGVLNSPALPLQREQYRFVLPSVPMLGASTHARVGGRGTHVQAAYGQAGAYTGTRAVGFEAADGNVASLGAQWAWSPAWSSAASYLATHGRLVPDARGKALLQPGHARAVHASTAWRSDDAFVQANALGSRTDDHDATGLWVDARARQGRYVHHFGLFRLEPDLAWGAYPIQNNAEGLYYRLGHDYGRWNWHGGLDTLQALAGPRQAIRYATAYARYQATSRRGYGATLSVRQANEDAARLQLFTDLRSQRGQTRLQLDLANAADEDNWQLGVDHAWALRQGARLSASVALGRLTYHDPEREAASTPESTRTGTVALLGGLDVTERLSLDGSLRWTHGDGAAALRGLDFNIGLDWRIAPRWALSFAAYQSQGTRRSPFILDPLVTRTPYIALPRERSLLLTLQYRLDAGRAPIVIGGGAGAATGSVVGSVYLDENRNGVRDASELPASNVTVVIDGRYSIRTDADGRFGFPRVAEGRHTLKVESDNLPLPWSFDDEEARTIEVGVREEVRVDIGALRPL